MAKAKYTYKYNGIVVRNSNRLYSFGLVNHVGGVIASSSTEQGALKVKNETITRLEKNIDYYRGKGKAEYLEAAEKDLENAKKWHTVILEKIEN